MVNGDGVTLRMGSIPRDVFEQIIYERDLSGPGKTQSLRSEELDRLRRVDSVWVTSAAEAEYLCNFGFDRRALFVVPPMLAYPPPKLGTASGPLATDTACAL